MKATVKKISKNRKYSDDFKKELVSLFESGKHSVLELQQLYGVSTSVTYRWIYKFSTFNKKGVRVVEMKESSSKKLEEFIKKNKELEQIVGRKQIRIDYLEKLIELAEKEFKINLKKN